MRTNSENDHVKNLANFDVLLSKIVSFGLSYRPVKRDIQLETLTCISQNAKAAINNIALLLELYVHTVAIREVAFEALRLLNLDLFKLLKSLNNINETEVYMLVGSGKIRYDQFASQERYDYLLNNFCKIIKLLKTIAYDPQSRKALTIPSLDDCYATLYLKNNEVKRNSALLSNASLIRNEVMYRDNCGMVALASLAKTYIKYHYGLESEQFKVVNCLIIKNYPK